MVLSTSGKETNALHTEKHAIRVENHFADKCFKNSRESTKKRSQKPKRKKVSQLDDITESSYSFSEEILSVSSDYTANAVHMSKFKNKIFAYMEIVNELVKMQVDSGASCNVLPRKCLPMDTEIKKTDLKLTTYSKTALKVLGVAKISLQNPKNKKKYRAEFSIIDEDYTPLLSSATNGANNCSTRKHLASQIQLSGT